jgi:hypothetical protein
LLTIEKNEIMRKRQDKNNPSQSLLAETAQKLAEIDTELGSFAPHDKIYNSQRLAYRKILNNLQLGQLVVTQDFTKDFMQVEKVSTLIIVLDYIAADGNKIRKYYDFVATQFPDRTFYVQKSWQIIANVIRELGNMNEVIIWSDGGPKHFKNSHTLLMYSDLRDRKLNWCKFTYNFFYAYHGANICDSHAGAVKKVTKSMSGEKLPDTANFIVDAYNSLNNTNVTRLVNEADTSIRAATLKGIKSFHYFEFLGQRQLKLKEMFDTPDTDARPYTLMTLEEEDQQKKRRKQIRAEAKAAKEKAAAVKKAEILAKKAEIKKNKASKRKRKKNKENRGMQSPEQQRASRRARILIRSTANVVLLPNNKCVCLKENDIHCDDCNQQLFCIECNRKFFICKNCGRKCHKKCTDQKGYCNLLCRSEFYCKSANK